MGSKQLGFGDYEQSTAKKRTKREHFLSEMEAVVPWKALLDLIEPHYPKTSSKGGRPPYPLETPGSPGELPPEAPTDPYVTLSRHTAPVIQPLPAHRANGQTGQGAVGKFASGTHGCGDAYAAVVGASAAATRSAPD
jgi:hypothetical protein